MDYIGIPKNPNVEVLGWVNMDKKKWVTEANYTFIFNRALPCIIQHCTQQFANKRGFD